MLTERAGALLVLPVFAAGCAGKELARIPMTTEGTHEAAVQVTAAKPLSFWTYLDVEDDGTLQASYDIDLVEGGAVKARTTCNPFDVSVSVNKTEITAFGSRTLKYDGKMKCSLVPTTTGPATARVTLKFATHPKKLDVRSLTLLVKE